ncbi:ParB/RepB/Spo0J family partition protein [Streptomyces sp. NBC_00576]|uniref:ParB/RepB/Spo0J family partition protein n=1 Tax=Streptomyces sp. NBC_00576 TaxID=2903665 RepID=UPI002E807C6D|nr:ParB N-terminal domain-containing protein [Streptomyces sp. NBC_00576]WUB68695.1 transcriptional regulator [Streptomyces sp. NBC_00576]WUB77001.1 transcriptional regulator [Streptomyces sp. NBC_00576]
MVTVEIASLVPGDSLRSNGVEQAHVVALAEVDGLLPPILVHRRTMRVIDGMHRLFAALLQGRQTIEVELFDGTQEEAFLRAVRANVVHGLPLSLADRRAAAARIMASHPHMSDRAIARASGLGAKTVASMRHSSAAAVPQLNTRVGRDGRVRPLNALEGRRRAVAVLAEHPDASLREVARLSGVSPATVSDVRRRLAAGESPLPPGPEPDEVPGMERGGVPHQRAGSDSRSNPNCVDPVSVLEKLLRDPSLRHKEGGRQLLHLLRQNAVGVQDLVDLSGAVPPHCRSLIINLARHYRDAWQGFAEVLDSV